MNQGTICAKVYPEGVQSIKGNNFGLIPVLHLILNPGQVTISYSVDI